MRSITQVEAIKDRILLLRDQRVMLDRDLAALYRVPTGRLNQQVKRNRNRFPGDFMFQLTAGEAKAVRVRMLGQEGLWRGKLPYAFTEQGAGMLAAVLRSPTAAAVTIQILRAFKRLRRGEEFPESAGFDRRCSLFAAIRDAVFCCPDDKPFTTQVPCTYFVQAGADGPIKIGSTRNLVVRLRTVGTKSPIPLRLLGVMKGDNEEDCHVRLAAFRLHGEWFAPSETVRQFVRSNAITSSASEEQSGILSEGT